MSMAEETEAPPRRKGIMLPVLVGLVLASAAGGGAFYAVYSGWVLAPDAKPAEAPAPATQLAPIAFVPIDPMIVSLGTPGRGRHLRFRGELEVVPGRQDSVTQLMPRILDVLNGYLRAVPLAELETPSALVLLRAQMLRRVQLVVGDDVVRDLLVTEFVLN